MTRKGEIIEALIEASKWRKQLRYATSHKRPDLAFTAIDNIFALHEKALRAFVKNRPRRRGVRPRSKTTSADAATANAPSPPSGP